MKQSKFAGRIVQSYEQCDYYRQGGELIAGYRSYETFAEEDKIKERNKYGCRPSATFWYRQWLWGEYNHIMNCVKSSNTLSH